MGVLTLVRMQGRIVCWPAVLLTLLALALGPLLGALGHLDPGGREGIDLALIPTILASGLGVRLFGREAAGNQGAWHRMLPVSRERLFGIKLAVGLGTLLACWLVPLLVWWLGAPTPWGERITRGLVFVPPDRAEALRQLDWIVAVFLASAYFASSFERVATAGQAGMPGWIAGTVLHAVLAAVTDLVAPDAGTRDAVYVLLWLGCMAAIALAARSLWRRRGVVAGGPHERVLADPRPLDARFSVPAQLLLVVAPITLFLLELDAVEKVARYTGLDRTRIVVLLWLGLGVACLPWSLRQLRARGLDAARVAGGLLLCLSGAGIFVWKVVRSKGGATRCTSCGRRRQTSLVRCPACGGRSTVPPRAPRAAAWSWVLTPWGIVLSLFFGSAALPALLGAIRVVHTWEIDAGHPDLDVVVNGEVVGTGVARGWSLGDRLGPWQGWLHGWATFGGRVPSAREPLRVLAVGDLVDGLLFDANDDDSGSFLVGRWPEPRDLLLGAFRKGDRIELRSRTAPDTVVEMTGFTAREEIDVWSMGIELEFASRMPGLEGVAEAAVVAEELSDARVRELVALGDPFLESLLEMLHPRLDLELIPDLPQGEFATRRVPTPEHALVTRARGLELFDRILEARYADGSDPAGPAGPGGRPDRLWSELEQRVARLEPLEQEAGNDRLHDHVRLLRPQLVAFGRWGGDRLGRELERGSPHALLAQGLSGDPGHWEACLDALDARDPVPWSRAARFTQLRLDPVRLAATWALLAVDRPRTAELFLERLRERLDPELLELVAFAGDARLIEALEDWLARPDPELARALRIPKLKSVENVRARLRTAITGLRWELEPLDYWERTPNFVMHIRP